MAAAPLRDNIFAAEFEDDWPQAPLGANDIFLNFTVDVEGEIGQELPVIQYD